jgi:hypothetical protein
MGKGRRFWLPGPSQLPFKLVSQLGAVLRFDKDA